MKTANIADFKAHFGQFMATVERGEEVQICKRNVPIAVVVPIESDSHGPRTKLGCGSGTVKIIGDLTEPAFCLDDWDALR